MQNARCIDRCPKVRRLRFGRTACKAPKARPRAAHSCASASDRCVRTAFSVKIASAGCKQSEFTGKGREKPRLTFRCGTVKSFNTPYSLVGKVADKLMRIAFFHQHRVGKYCSSARARNGIDDSLRRGVFLLYIRKSVSVQYAAEGIGCVFGVACAASAAA